MKVATKKQLDRAVNAQKEVERLDNLLSTQLSEDDWVRVSREYADARAERDKANRVLKNIETFNAR